VFIPKEICPNGDVSFKGSVQKFIQYLIFTLRANSAMFVADSTSIFHTELYK
jgi:hypothetical protein